MQRKRRRIKYDYTGLTIYPQAVVQYIIKTPVPSHILIIMLALPLKTCEYFLIGYGLKKELTAVSFTNPFM